MIPVEPSPEPVDFDARVRKPGQRWCRARGPEGEFNPYWLECRDALQEAFADRCAYLGCWISSGEVDHFWPKKQRPDLAYEWSNLRWCDGRVNRLKGDRIFLDPFEIGADWVRLDPCTLEFVPGPGLPARHRDAATITFHALNDKVFLRSRRQLFEDFRPGWQADPDHALRRIFPLMAGVLDAYAAANLTATDPGR